MKNEQVIDLKSRVLSLEKQSLNQWVSFTTQILDDKTLDELAVLAGMLERVGFTLEVARNQNNGLGLDYDFITVRVNEERYKHTVTRHAGRKADFNEKYDKYGKCTVAELKEKLLTTTKTQIADELGCSRMTLYRIIKNISSLNPAGDTSIWHYTS